MPVKKTTEKKTKHVHTVSFNEAELRLAYAACVNAVSSNPKTQSRVVKKLRDCLLELVLSK